MFTGNTLRLKDFDGKFGLQVQRNCDFSYVAKVPTRLARRIVPCEKPLHITNAVKNKGIVGIVTTHELAALVPEALGLALAAQPVLAAIQLHEHVADIPDFQWRSFATRIHPSAIVHSSASISENDVEIGAGTIVHPNAVLFPRTFIGENCSIGAGTVVSTDAFEINTRVAPYAIIRQSGGVRLADNVDVQAKCTLVRATFGGFTELGAETKLDCQVHFAHDCIAGKRVRIAACAELSGRVEIGDDCFIGPNVSVSNGVRIGARAQVTIGSVVTRDVQDDQTVTGNFAVPHEKWLAFVKAVNAGRTGE